MKGTLFYLLTIGVFLIFGGSALYYFQSYRGKAGIDFLSLIFSAGGWYMIFYGITRHTLVQAPRRFYQGNALKKVQRGFAVLFAYLVFIGVLAVNLIYVANLTKKRERLIFETGPTKTAVATVIEIRVHKGKNGPYYYAIFEYTVGEKVIDYSRSEHPGDFLEGQRYEIRYSVPYPELFRIIQQLPQDPPNVAANK